MKHTSFQYLFPITLVAMTIAFSAFVVFQENRLLLPANENADIVPIATVASVQNEKTPEPTTTPAQTIEVVSDPQSPTTPNALQPSPALSAKPMPAPKTKSSGCATGQNETKLITLINQARADNNVPALATDSKLSCTADLHAQAMASGLGLNHIDAQSHTFSQRCQAQGTVCRGENLGYTPSGNVAVLIPLWLGNPVHRNILLDPVFSNAGAGYHGGYATILFR